MAQPQLPPPYVESYASALKRKAASGPTVGLKTKEAWSACYAWAIPHVLAAGLATAWIMSAGRPFMGEDLFSAVAGSALGWTVVSVVGAALRA